MTLPFEERACFAAGQAKTGTTLLIALLDGHPQLLVLPEETAYFPTALNKYGKRGRRAQFDYLTKEALSRVLFGGPPEWEKMDYGHFPVAEFRERFETACVRSKKFGQRFTRLDDGDVCGDAPAFRSIRLCAGWKKRRRIAVLFRRFSSGFRRRNF